MSIAHVGTRDREVGNHFFTYHAFEVASGRATYHSLEAAGLVSFEYFAFCKPFIIIGDGVDKQCCVARVGGRGKEGVYFSHGEIGKVEGMEAPSSQGKL